MQREQKNGCKMIFCFVMLVIGLAPMLGPTVIQSQEAKFPSKPLEIVVPFAPGGFTDIASRIVAEFLPQELKVPVVIRNQPGGGGLTAAQAFLNVKPDGYTLLAVNAAAVISTVQLAKTPPFDPRKDFLPVGYVGDCPFVMVVPKASPFKSIEEFVQYARSNPGKLKGGFAMVGTETHFVFLSIVRDTKIEVKQIPFTGAAQINPAFLGGHVDWITQSLPGSMPYLRSGDARPLLITRPSRELPGVPTGSEKGLPSVSLNMWLGLFVLSQTPKPVYDRLVSALEATVKNPELNKKLTGIGLDVDYKNPHGFSNLLEEQWRIYSQIIKETGMKVD